MEARLRVLASRYVDSVLLMRLAQRLAAQDGIEDAAAVMGTEANRALLAEGGFLPGPVDAGADDLIVAAKAETGEAADRALALVDELLLAPGGATASVRTLDEAVEVRPSANVAVISVPGEHAGPEARRALELGLHVFCFSSNVPLEQEVELKRLASSRGLLCMGPDCGTAIVAGKGLGFANVVRRGPVGVVGSSGTGIQVVTATLDRFGIGISHAIGCGSRDLSEEVGAVTTLDGVEALLANDATRAVVVVSKPAAPAVARRLRDRFAGASKPVVFGFLGDPESPPTLDAVARAAAEALGVTPPEDELVFDRLAVPAASQRFVRGLFSGGTLAYEAQLVLRAAGLDVGSNAPLPGGRLLADAARSEGHAILDLGSEELTRGRPHPMIDSRIRRARLLEEARDPEVAAILLDVVLGHGSAADPAGDLAAAIAEGRAVAAAAGRDLEVLAYVCGTEADPQCLSAQARTLREAGAIVLPSSAAVARIAAFLVPALELTR